MRWDSRRHIEWCLLRLPCYGNYRTTSRLVLQRAIETLLAAQGVMRFGAMIQSLRNGKGFNPEMKPEMIRLEFQQRISMRSLISEGKLSQPLPQFQSICVIRGNF